jgi:hypothetical protein
MAPPKEALLSRPQINANIDRRSFLLSPVAAGSLLVLAPTLRAAPVAAPDAKGTGAEHNGGPVHLEGAQYDFEWSPKNDRFTLRDRKARMVSAGNMQPAITVAGSGTQAPVCSPGTVKSYNATTTGLEITYEGVNHTGRITLKWRCDRAGLWLDPIIYESTASESIVAVRYFATCVKGNPEPSLENSYLVLPGISMSSALSPIVPSLMNLDFRGWLGHGSLMPSSFQQWALPSDYFCGFHLNKSFNENCAMTEGLSDAFCCGAADLPAGDLMFETRSGKHGPVVNYRGDLWGHMRGPGRMVLGCTWAWALGPNFYEAIRQYYLNLVEAGLVSRKQNSAHKNSVALAPQYNTWGAEVASGKDWAEFDEPLLLSIYDGLASSGMKAGTFVIDAKWQGKYGLLEHSPQRFPHFEQILARIRSDGHHLGMWAAFMRCEDPRDLGLETRHMLHRADGSPITLKEESTDYYLFDFTQPEVQEVLRRTAKAFIKRYQLDLVKFDFGYELPSLDAGAPKDMAWAGEKLLLKGLEVVVNAMREENPDLVVMYYSLSPLYNAYFDLHSPDDMFMCSQEYDLEANRRFFFSSLLGEIGMPTYGSGGYDWRTMPQIWFDSAPIGTLGSLNSFSGDEQGERATPERVAKYNGLAHVLRTSNVFSIKPIGADYVSPTRGARTPSWARLENDQVVLLALRRRGGLGIETAAEFGGIAQATASVVVASRTTQGIQHASQLAIVPYGNGELKIKRSDEVKQAEMVEHVWGGQVGTRNRITIEGGMLIIPLRERTADGVQVEWIEVNYP